MKYLNFFILCCFPFCKCFFHAFPQNEETEWERVRDMKLKIVSQEALALRLAVLEKLQKWVVEYLCLMLQSWTIQTTFPVMFSPFLVFVFLFLLSAAAFLYFCLFVMLLLLLFLCLGNVLFLLKRKFLAAKTTNVKMEKNENC